MYVVLGIEITKRICCPKGWAALPLAAVKALPQAVRTYFYHIVWLTREPATTQAD
jgi:hypothetical protein